MKRRSWNALALAIGVFGLTAAARAVRQDSEPCCSIAALDATRGIVTVKDKAGRFSFAAVLADKRAVTGLRVGRSLWLSNNPKSLILPTASGTPQTIAVIEIRFLGLSAQSAPGVVGSAVSSSGGTFVREPNTKRCPWLKETPTTQCVLTHVTPSMCEYFCVTINR
jgi:hypothetical protein